MNINSSFSHRKEEPENSVLYVVGTPIGNLNDISHRAIQILRNVSLIACEDTRQTRKLMNKYSFNNSLLSFYKNNSFKKIPKIISFLKEGKSIAIVSDAGMPGICDPGEDLVREAILNNIRIISIPGPCAAITALVSSGFPCSAFNFLGFLPKKKIDREKILLKISNEEKTTILYESPHRIKNLLQELKEYCGGEREMKVFRELTKKFEEHIGTNINMIIDFFENKKILGEITLVIKGVNVNLIEGSEINKSYFKKELHELINAGLSLSAASKYLAKKNSLTKNIIYNLY